MAVSGILQRYMLIVNFIGRHSYPSLNDIVNYLQQKQDNDSWEGGPKAGVSRRSAERSMNELRDELGIDIRYDRVHKGYYIEHNPAMDTGFRGLVESFEIFHSLNVAKDIASFLNLEKRRPQGTDHLFGLLHAIRENLLIGFEYEKYGDETLTKRKVAPMAMKEFRSRWYLIAREEQQLKCFALDRIHGLEITRKKFDPGDRAEADNRYRHSFGIISPGEEQPETVVLSFRPLQGKYIKSLPLHHSQKIEADNDRETRVSLYLYITYDLVMELLSYGDTVRVLQPASLINNIKATLENAWNQYR